MAKRGEAPAVKVGKLWRYRASTLDAWINSRLQSNRQSSRRTKVPRILTTEEFKRLLDELKEPYRTIVLVAGCLGLRISEITALQWDDIDWEALTLLVQRSFVSGKVYETKTEASQKPLPLDPQLAEVLLKFRGQSVYIPPGDFIFAGNSGKPRWQGIMMTDHIKPAAQRAGIWKEYRLAHFQAHVLVDPAQCRNKHGRAERAATARSYFHHHEYVRSGGQPREARSGPPSGEGAFECVKKRELVRICTR